MNPDEEVKDDNPDSGFYCMGCDEYGVELDCIKKQQDLQLAAELGNTLLERNKDLESTIKHQQGVIEDQIQEIEFLTKQTAALKEVNESRVRIYEQIEISLSELEHNNLKLNEDSAAEKSKIRSLSSTVSSLETKCEELQRSLEEAELIIQQRKEKRKSVFLQENPASESLCLNCSKPNEKSSRKNSQILFCDDPNVSPESLGIAALFVESLKCDNQINLNQCRNYKDAASETSPGPGDSGETDRAEILRLEEEAGCERRRIRELEDQIETLLSEKDDLLETVKAAEVKISQSRSELENNNNLRELSHPFRPVLCARCSLLEGEEGGTLTTILPFLEGLWQLVLRKV